MLRGTVIIHLLMPIVLGSTIPDDDGVVRNLIGEPDYKSVKLHWVSENLDPDGDDDGFLVRYCELQSWGAQRCRTQQVDEPDNNNIEIEENSLPYTVNIDGLRMATTYSFEIKSNKMMGKRENRAEIDKNENVIVIPTKGFSARATQCLPQASEIEVSTGPFFGGRIAVESSDGEKCAIDGEPNSPRDTYILRINHSECGSQVNETTVATFVIVQENLPILTHSTRRFLVLCSYQPETLTVRAGINLPTNNKHSHGQASIMLEDDDGGEQGSKRRARNMRTNRLIQKPEALVTDDLDYLKESHPYASRGNPFPIIAATLLTIIAIVGLIMLLIRWNLKKLSNELDNVSITSNRSDLSSISSSSTCTQIESDSRFNI